MEFEIYSTDGISIT